MAIEYDDSVSRGHAQSEKTPRRSGVPAAAMVRTSLLRTGVPAH